MMPPTAWVRVPQALWDRVTGRGAENPWIVPQAVNHLARIAKPNWRVFEFGSGQSTAWYAARVAEVVSLEDDVSWHSKVSRKLSLVGHSNCDLRLVPLESFPELVTTFPDESFHLIVVDSNESSPGDRLKCLSAAAKKVKRGYYMVLDDSDRASCRESDRLLSGWPVRRFVGLKPFPLTAVETSVYQRPKIDGIARSEGYVVSRDWRND